MSYSNPASSPLLSDLFSLKGKTALVVGGAGLLGSEISFALAECGADIIVASRDIEKCNTRVAELKAKFPETNPSALTIDIGNPQSIKDAVAKASEGAIDILVNCGWSGRKNTFESISDEDWNNDIEICLNGVFRTIKAALPALIRSKGVVLSVASMYGHVAPDYRLYGDGTRFANPPSYGAAKAGVIQLTKYCASFLSPHGIRINAISPGPFPFEKTQNDSPDFIERLAAKNPLGRIGKPHELKAVAALLCSDASSYMTGQNICVDGGWAVW